jgi:hypothetical protein
MGPSSRVHNPDSASWQRDLGNDGMTHFVCFTLVVLCIAFLSPGEKRAKVGDQGDLFGFTYRLKNWVIYSRKSGKDRPDSHIFALHPRNAYSGALECGFPRKSRMYGPARVKRRKTRGGFVRKPQSGVSLSFHVLQVCSRRLVIAVQVKPDECPVVLRWRGNRLDTQPVP